MNAPKSFWVQTLGCKVNAADSERISAHLRRRGLTSVDKPELADLRVVNTCSVTTSAAAQSRQAARKLTRLPLLSDSLTPPASPASQAKVMVTGCWSTSNTADAQNLPGVDAVLTHATPLEPQLDHHLTVWGVPPTPKSLPLPQFSQKASRQRAYLKIQDGCDAHCTYCIIPKLRTNLWSLGPDETLTQARQLLDAGHNEIILTGIFLGAFGHPTALRRRQTNPGGSHLASLIHHLCQNLPPTFRLRLSSLEPGDLTEDLLSALASYPQVTRHFHLPLQSGSDAVLHQMNRQYTQADFLGLIDRLNQTFNRPALTTDIVAGFPGETDADFAETLKVAHHARFLHIHAFPFSPRPGTAAARWTKQFIPNGLANTRVATLTQTAQSHALVYRQSFLRQEVTAIIEKGMSPQGHPHGRTERYFDIELPGETLLPGTLVKATITEVTPTSTIAEVQ